MQTSISYERSSITSVTHNQSSSKIAVVKSNTNDSNQISIEKSLTLDTIDLHLNLNPVVEYSDIADTFETVERTSVVNTVERIKGSKRCFLIQNLGETETDLLPNTTVLAIEPFVSVTHTPHSSSRYTLITADDSLIANDQIHAVNINPSEVEHSSAIKKKNEGEKTYETRISMTQNLHPTTRYVNGKYTFMMKKIDCSVLQLHKMTQNELKNVLIKFLI